MAPRRHREFDALAGAADTEAAQRIFERIVGQRIGANVRTKVASIVSAGRKQHQLSVTPSGLLTAGSGLRVPANTFFGAWERGCHESGH